MLTVLGAQRRFCDGITRRQVLTAGATALLGGLVGLPGVFAAQERQSIAARRARAKNVIHLYLHGGAPTQDMWDIKPDAPVEVRGQFKPIATSAPGVRICEHLPRTARWMHRCAIIRSVHHKAGCHNTLPSFTGSEQPVDVNEPIPRDSYPPGMGSVCEYLKPPGQDLPAYVAMPHYLGWGFALKRPGPWGGFLGHRFDPLLSEMQPVPQKAPPPGRKPLWLGAPYLADAALGPGLTLDRLNRRQSLLQQIDDEARRVDAAASGYDRVRQRAFSLLTASTLRRAFDLSLEDPRLRERYGEHLPGSSALIARRLIEAGVRFVDVYFDGYTGRFPGGPDVYWDTHSNNFTQLKQANLPLVDQTVSALFEDLDGRGLLDETLIVISSDFGRTPQVNAAAGRDHWTSCYCVVFAGAGIRGGTLCGASDAHAAYVKDRPVRPADICATVLSSLGIDPDMPVYDKAGRPVPVANGGEPIHELLA